MSAVTEVTPELTGYLDELVESMASVTDLDAVYVIGSAALGAYVRGESDVDVIAVTSHSLDHAERRALAEAAEAVPCPARKLEIVVYARGSEIWEINLNTAELVSFDVDEVPGFWFVIDRAIAEQHAIPILGPPWSEVFDPVPRDAILDALDQSVEIIGALNMVRAEIWLETGEWVSKLAAEAWMRERVRAEIEAAR